MTSTAKQLYKFSVRVGDRFGAEADAQLRACEMALDEAGVEVTPVWNKSNREHTIIGSVPTETRKAAVAAVRSAHWARPYFVDADHINRETVGRFLEPCDFFTIDVADWIGKPTEPEPSTALLPRIRNWSASSNLRELSSRSPQIGSSWPQLPTNFLRPSRRRAEHIATLRRTRTAPGSSLRSRSTRRMLRRRPAELLMSSWLRRTFETVTTDVCVRLSRTRCTSLTVNLPMGLHVERMPDDPTLQAFLYGPLVLATGVSATEVPKNLVIGPMGPDFKKEGPADVPASQASVADSQNWKRTSPHNLAFEFAASERLIFVPFNSVGAEERYALYWKVI